MLHQTNVFYPPQAFKRMQWVETVEEMQQFLMLRWRESCTQGLPAWSNLKTEDMHVIRVLKAAALLGFSSILVFATLPRHSILHYFSLLQTFVNGRILTSLFCYWRYPLATSVRFGEFCVYFLVVCLICYFVLVVKVAS